MDTFWRDVKFGIRSLLKSPGFAIAAILSIALGIGANTTIFTLVNAVFLNPLPVERSSELVAAYTSDAHGPQGFGGLLQTSYPNLKDYREKNAVFTDMAGYTFPFPVSLVRSSEGAQPAFVEVVTGNFFDVLGVKPYAGRFFLPEEDRAERANPVAVLAYGFWQRRLGGMANLIGTTLKLNGTAYTVVGIAPEGFKGVNSLFSPDMWVPSMMFRDLAPAQFKDWLDSRRALTFSIAARLRPAIVPAQAEAQLKTIAQALEQEYPVENKGRTLVLRPLAQATVFPGLRDALALGGVVLMTIVGLVLLIACSNVANLLIVRGMGRRQEIAVRVALGATRRQLLRQLLTESVLLSLCGGVLGLFIAYLARNGVWSLRPPFIAQNFVEFALDRRVLAFTALVSLMTGLLFGWLPGRQASRADVVDALKEETRTAGRSRHRMRLGNALVVGQVALSVLALVAAGLFLRSLQEAHRINTGFDTAHLGTVFVSPGQAGYSQARAEDFYRQVRERVAGLPGVAAVSWNSTAPLTGGFQRTMIPEGREADSTQHLFAVAHSSTPGYFDTMRIAMRRGRDFTDVDRKGTLPVAIVNEVLASRMWPGENAVGKRFKFITGPDYLEVVGVVATSKYLTIGEDPTPAVFVPLSQEFSDTVALFVRSGGDPAEALGGALREIRSMDPQIPLNNPATMTQVLEQSLWAAKMAAILLGSLGILALILAAVGLYGVISYSVGQRRQEIGLRMALGAAAPDVMGLVIREGMLLVAIGMAIGLGVAFGVGMVGASVVSTILYGVSATDLVAFGTVTILLAIVALAACVIPAFRASRLDPILALR